MIDHPATPPNRSVPLDEVFNNERLARWERETVEWRTPDGTEYLLGATGGTLFVPHDEEH